MSEKNRTNSSGRGGARKGAGRPAGAATKRTREIADRAAESGLTPLDYMLQVMRNECNDMPVRLDAAKSAAPYIHAKLANVQVTGKDGGPVQVESFRLVPLTSAG